MDYYHVLQMRKLRPRAARRGQSWNLKPGRRGGRAPASLYHKITIGRFLSIEIISA